MTKFWCKIAVFAKKAVLGIGIVQKSQNLNFSMQNSGFWKKIQNNWAQKFSQNSGIFWVFSQKNQDFKALLSQF